VKSRRVPQRGEGAAPPLRWGAGAGRRLSEGALVQGSVRARLLGLPLLRLDATIVLVPATSEAQPGVIATGDGLAEAVRSINAGAEILARARLDGRG
jgi:hypothetical protein